MPRRCLKPTESSKFQIYLHINVRNKNTAPLSQKDALANALATSSCTFSETSFGTRSGTRTGRKLTLCLGTRPNTNRTLTNFCRRRNPASAKPTSRCFPGAHEESLSGVRGIQFPKSAPAHFECEQRKARNNTGVGYGGAVSMRSGRTPVRAVRAELASLSLGVVRPGTLLLRGPSSTERWFRSQRSN